MPKPKRLPAEITVRLRGYQVVLSRARNRIELRREQPGGQSTVVNHYATESALEVQLFLGADGHRKVLLLAHDVALDLGDSLTSLEALAEAREVARLIDRPLQIRVMAYQDAYFADAAPLLYAYSLPADLSGRDSAELELATLIQRIPSSHGAGDEDPTVDDAPAV